MNWIKELRSEDHRDTILRVGAWGSWAIALIWTGFHSAEVTPQELGVIIVMLLGAAIASGLALSRRAMTDTITEVFHAGVASAVAVSSNIHTDTCVISLERHESNGELAAKGGVIRHADHSDVIGWHDEELVGLNLTDLVPARMANRFRDSLSARVTLKVPIADIDGREHPCRVTVSDFGDHTIATITPTEPINGNTGRHTE